VYRGRVKIPVEGRYDVAFMMDSPQFLHCFAATVVPGEEAEGAGDSRMAVEYQVTDRRLKVGEEKTIQFRLFNPKNGVPENNVADATVLYYRSDGRGRTVQPARELGNGLYEASVTVDMPATYYVFVSVPSKGLDYSDQPFFSLMALEPPPEESTQ
jgi:hypothetical protein